MLTLKKKGASNIPLEAEVIRPDQLAGTAPAEIARLPLQHGNAQVPLAEFFDLQGNADDEQIRLEGDCARVKWIGAGMTRGRIVVDGPAGMHLGSEMIGGEIEVQGDAGDWVGAEMRGGRIHVRGNAGHLVGAAYRGSRHGMRGGVILIDGNAENEIGSTMRRGLIAIGGASGDFAGVSMIAGTIFLGGATGQRAAAGMKRGSLVLLQPGAYQPLLSFRYACTYRPTFLALYLKRLAAWGFAVRPEWARASYRRYQGDLVAIGKGEILHLATGGTP